jgi:putative transposase
MISQPQPDFSVVEQCALLKMPRSTLYYKPKPVSEDDLTLMRRIDEVYRKWPFYGSRKIVAELPDERDDVNRKRVDYQDGRSLRSFRAYRGVQL